MRILVTGVCGRLGNAVAEEAGREGHEVIGIDQQGISLTHEHFWPVFSIRKAKLELGWEPQDTFEKWLRETGWDK